MNLLQMAQRLHRESGRSGSEPTSITGATGMHARLFDWLGDAWRELQARPIDWRWMRKTLDGETEVDEMAYSGAELGADDWGRWNIGHDEYGVKAYDPAAPDHWWRLNWMPYDQFRETYIDTTQPAGRPIDWSVDDAGDMLIGPLSDIPYGIKADYLTAPTELAADEDTPTMPAIYHMLLVWRALAEIGKFDNSPDVLARASSNYGTMELALLASQARPIELGGALA
jgi:hypothetical protein